MKNKKRDLFSELMTGVGEMGLQREGKITLKSAKITPLVLPKLSPTKIRKIRDALNLSRAALAQMLQVNVRTLENWEQGRTEPNEQAVALLLLVDAYPDTLQRLREIAA